MPGRKANPAYTPRTALIRARREKWKGMLARDFAKLLGCSRLHMTSIEVGRRDPSVPLALRWLELLGPEADFEMFQPVSMLDEAVRVAKRLKEVKPEIFEAA